MLLHATGYFHWEYWFWNVPFVLPIVIFGYLWFFLVAAYVFDMRDVRRQARFVGWMAAPGGDGDRRLRPDPGVDLARRGSLPQETGTSTGTQLLQPRRKPFIDAEFG